MEEFIQYLIAVLNLGSIYALLALGLVVVFGQLGFLNFAHGDLMTLFGYALLFQTVWGVPFWLAVLISILFAGLCAVAMERIAFRPLRGQSPMSLLITSFAISGALHVIFQVTISPRSKPIPIPEFLSGYITIGDVFIGRAQIFTVIVAVGSLLLLRYFLTRSQMGIALRASAADFDVARAMGIRANRVIALAFFLSGVLAGIAALLWIAQRGAVFPTLGLTPMIKALIAAIIGGLTNPKGALYGGFLLGALEATLLSILPDEFVVFRDAAVLLILIGFLVYRPNGIIATNPEPMR
jgi:branched-chain amino acid transport system permease protein|tara:strand:- start:39 stop:926 length:888 start_codon:yes stop_codon:yes gene_type:complete